MDMRVDPSRDDDLTGRIDGTSGTDRKGSRRADGDDCSTIDTDIDRLRPCRENRETSRNDDVQQLSLLR